MKKSILVASVFLMSVSAFGKEPPKETAPCIELKALRENIRTQEDYLDDLRDQVHETKRSGDNAAYMESKQKYEKAVGTLAKSEGEAALDKISCDGSHGNIVFKSSICPDGFEDVGGTQNSDPSLDTVLCHKKDKPSVATDFHELKVTRATGPSVDAPTQGLANADSATTGQKTP